MLAVSAGVLWSGIMCLASPSVVQVFRGKYVYAVLRLKQGIYVVHVVSWAMCQLSLASQTQPTPAQVAFSIYN